MEIIEIESPLDDLNCSECGRWLVKAVRFKTWLSKIDLCASCVTKARNIISDDLPKERTIMKPFYMIYVEGQDSPVVKHRSIDDAKKEAVRLCTHENKKAYVLRAVLEFSPVKNYTEASFDS